ncbi:MAG: aspartate aminotransferase family protein [Phycisphaeraceae bacterium]
MAAGGFPLEPRDVEQVQTKYRRIATKMPVPESLPIIEQLRKYEPWSMSGQPPVVWDRAEGFQVHDAWGNTWLDWSSGVLVTNAGHAHPEVRKATAAQIDKPLMHNYCFPTQIRAELVKELVESTPATLEKAFLLTTGSETTECAIKLMRTHGQSVGGKRKIGIVGFVNGFHGRTMGAQMAGGVQAAKEWMVNLDPSMVQVPYPDGFRQQDTSFDVFLDSLKKQGFEPADIAGVIVETYQGGNAQLAPNQYMQKLRAWCDEHDILLTFDEVQAGFGRTGKMFCYEHYGVDADLVCCGKGISSGMPLGAVLGRAKLLDQYPPGSMTSTHTGNPVCCAAALASLHAIKNEKMINNAAKLGQILDTELKRIGQRFGPAMGQPVATGLVGSIQVVKPGTTDPDGDLATDIVRRCVDAGLLMFAPVGVGGATVKIAPPLCTPEDALREGIEVLETAIEQATSAAPQATAS